MATTSTAAVWVGSQDLLEIPETEISFEANATKTTLTLEGPYEVCMAKRPKIGQKIHPYEGEVIQVKLTRKEGGVGSLKVSLEGGGDGGGGGETELGPPRYEIWTGEVEKPLETHPRYGKNGQYSKHMGSETTVPVEDAKAEGESSENLKDILENIFGKVKEWKGTVGELVQFLKTAKPGERSAILKNFKDSSAKGLLENFFAKWDAGMESYVIYMPMARSSQMFKNPQSIGKTGVIGSPAVSGVPSGYKWLKTEDRVSWTGRGGTCERVQEWRAAHEIDPEIYS